MVPWDELQYADEVHWCISGTPFYFFFIYLILFISDQKENSSCAPRLCCDAHQAFANLYQVYPGYELPGLTGRAQKACPSAVARAQLRNTLSWFLCFEEMEEGTVALCRRQTLSDTVYGQWGVRRGMRGLPEPLSHFYSCPMTDKQSLSCSSSCSLCLTGVRCHFCVALTHGTAVCHRAQGTYPCSEGFALGGMLALLHPPGRDAVHH